MAPSKASMKAMKTMKNATMKTMKTLRGGAAFGWRELTRYKNLRVAFTLSATDSSGEFWGDALCSVGAALGMSRVYAVCFQDGHRQSFSLWPAGLKAPSFVE